MRKKQRQQKRAVAYAINSKTHRAFDRCKYPIHRDYEMCNSKSADDTLIGRNTRGSRRRLD
jgi:hypothetical protein